MTNFEESVQKKEVSDVAKKKGIKTHVTRKHHELEVRMETELRQRAWRRVEEQRLEIIRLRHMISTAKLFVSGINTNAYVKNVTVAILESADK